MKKFEAKWTGNFPTLCLGTWKLYIDGQDKSNLIPKDLREQTMNTAGIYESWHFENWVEVFESYKDGLECDDWIKKNDDWISKIADCYDEKISLFKAFQVQDFRTCSCGGCM